MDRGLTLRRRVAIVARWPLGLSLALHSWRRSIPVRRRTLPGDPSQDLPPPLEIGVDPRGLQGPETGVGPLHHVRYEAHIRDGKRLPGELISHLQRELLKGQGDREQVLVGDELVLRPRGPWDGPLRVVEVTPTSFRLATAEGHPRAGQIEFAMVRGEPTLIRIELWARSADLLSALLYEGSRAGREIEAGFWTSMLERWIELSGGRLEGPLDEEIRRLHHSWPVERVVRSPRKRRALAALSHAPLNFDRSQRHELTSASGWKRNDHRQPLPPEPPGPPVRGGPWEMARRLMRGYEFADPSIVRAFYDPEAPLQGRNMLLELRFLGLRFLVGTRVTSVYEETRIEAGRKAQVWGWSYATLAGHLEKGEMFWEVHKCVDTGEVEFRIHAYSSRAEIGNPLTRLGFRLVGRREQLRFGRTTCARMRRLTEEAVRAGSSSEALRGVAEAVTARPAPAAAPAHAELARNAKIPPSADPPAGPR